METTPVLLSPELIREHLDLVIGPEDRAARGLWFVLCDDRAKPVVHAVVDDVPADVGGDACEAVVTTFAMALAEHGDEDGAMLVAVTRPGAGRIVEADRRWFRAVHSVCRRQGVKVLAVYLATPRETVPMYLDDAL